MTTRTVDRDPFDRLPPADRARIGRAMEQGMRPPGKAKSPARGKGFWNWLGGPVQTAPEPIPGSVAEILCWLRDGDRLDADDWARIAKDVGGPTARRLKKMFA